MSLLIVAASAVIGVEAQRPVAVFSSWADNPLVMGTSSARSTSYINESRIIRKKKCQKNEKKTFLRRGMDHTTLCCLFEDSITLAELPSKYFPRVKLSSFLQCLTSKMYFGKCSLKKKQKSLHKNLFSRGRKLT